MFATSGDILNMSLAIGFIVLVIFLSILIFYSILVMRDVSRMTQDSKELMDRIHNTIMGPLKAVDYIIEKVKPYIESTIENRFKKGKK
ncbi:hypothetical protein HZA40_00340 [Candidatus Peregrinibacteria bacterium]|nr:hypothetical protein [Candidatus Peregrinibacteria bacterium]